MAIPNGVGSRNHQSFVEDGTGVVARNAHITGGTLASITGVVGTVNVIAILGTITSVQTVATVSMLSAGTVTTLGTQQAGTLDMVKAGTVSMVVQQQAGTLDMVKAGTVSMLSAGTVTTVAMVQAGTLDMVKMGTTTMSTLISGEDQTNDVMKTEEQFSYAYSAAATADWIVKASGGFLHRIISGGTTAAGTIEVSDHASDGDGAVKILLANISAPLDFEVNAKFTTGITLDVTNQTNVTVIYR